MGPVYQLRLPVPEAVRFTTPYPQRVSPTVVGAEGMANTSTVTEDVLVHPELASVTVTSYTKVPVEAAVRVGLLTVVLFNQVAGFQTNVYGATGQNAQASPEAIVQLPEFLDGAAYPKVPV